MHKVFLVFLLAVCNLPSIAQLQLPAVFADNMVLQRDKPVSIRGWASPQKTVTISFLNKKYTAITNINGEWQLKLAAAKAGPAGSMVISTAGETITLKNILVGEVWVCSGQSNMEFTMSSFKDFYADEIKKSANENIRFVVVKRGFDNKEVAAGELSRGWSAIDPSTVGECSAVAYFYAKKLQERLKVPIGLINTSWGGTPAQSWMDTTALKAFPIYSHLYETSLKPLDFSKLKELENKQADQFRKKVAEAAAGFKATFTETYDDLQWENCQLPGNWEANGHPDLDGIAAYRIRFTLPKGFEDKQVVLHLPAIDDIDSTYINGTFVGSQAIWNELRVYKVPAGILKEGNNVLSVWIEDGIGGGGINADPQNFYLQLPRQRIPLQGPAKFKVLVPVAPIAPGVNLGSIQNAPGVLFNSMIAPILSYTIRGTIWYQGESNASEYEEYRSLFPALISNWRRRWGQGNFPFLFVQLSSYNPSPAEPAVSDWAFLREAQTMTLQLPNTGMAVTIDVGDRYDIHPKQKKQVGERLAANAFVLVYGYKNEVPAGPLYKTAVVKGNTVLLSFSNQGRGLMQKGTALSGFTIAGKDKKFVPAKATIKGNLVVVSAAEIAAPLYVRYAWANAPMDANLYNKEGFPASPFRTDK